MMKERFILFLIFCGVIFEGAASRQTGFTQQNVTAIVKDTLFRGRLAPFAVNYQFIPSSGVLQVEVTNQSSEKGHVHTRMGNSSILVVCKDSTGKQIYVNKNGFYPGIEDIRKAAYFNPGQTRVYDYKIRRAVLERHIPWDRVALVELSIYFQYSIYQIPISRRFIVRDDIPLNHKKRDPYRVELKYESDFPGEEDRLEFD